MYICRSIMGGTLIEFRAVVGRDWNMVDSKY